MPISPRRRLAFTAGGTLVPRTPTPEGGNIVGPGTPGAPGSPQQPTPPAPPVTGAPGAGLGGAAGPAAPGRPIDPVDVQVGAPTLGSFQAHQDAAMEQARRTLDPMWEANKRRFEQDMINRGLTPGSEAYNLALDQHNRGRTDAYGAAQNAALQQGQQAQQQAFQQAYMESELANQLRRAREGNAAQIQSADISAGASMYGNDQARLNFLDQLGFNRDQFNSEFGLRTQDWQRQGDQWQQQFGLGQQNSDFNQMMQMMGFDRDTTNMGNQNQNQQFAQIMSLFGMMPQPQGSQPIDYMGALGMNQNQQNANYQTGVNNANQQNANYMQLLGYFMCDENVKDVGAPVDTAKCLKIALGLPLVNFTYKADVTKRPCVGTMAQDFNTALHGTPAPGGEPLIKVMDMIGVLLGAVQELGKRYDELRADLGRPEAA